MGEAENRPSYWRYLRESGSRAVWAMTDAPSIVLKVLAPISFATALLTTFAGKIVPYWMLAIAFVPNWVFPALQWGQWIFFVIVVFLLFSRSFWLDHVGVEMRARNAERTVLSKRLDQSHKAAIVNTAMFEMIDAFKKRPDDFVALKESATAFLRAALSNGENADAVGKKKNSSDCGQELYFIATGNRRAKAEDVHPDFDPDEWPKEKYLAEGIK